MGCFVCRSSCHHELETARINGLLGNIDANTGDPQIGKFQIFYLSNQIIIINSIWILMLQAGTLTSSLLILERRR